MALCVLIVEDSMPMRGVIKKTIKAAGYRTSTFFEAENGQKALEVIESNWVDIILTDFNMPVLNGLELILEMKKDELFKKIPIVMVTTEGSKEKIDEFMDKGAAGYIRKPFTPEQIRDLLSEILGEAEYDDELEDSGGEFDF
ncbi:MAG: response regulator [Desulfobacteraceae bacterium]|nr:response regulator [Desulfobacteraceae bacterium]